MSARLSLALGPGGLVLPETGPVAVFAARADADLGALPKARVQVIQPVYPDHAALAAAGYDCRVAPEAGPYAAAVVFVPRAKAEARALIARAAALTDGPVAVDGARTDGIDSLLREIRRRTEVSEPVSKAHGKLFWFAPAAERFADWRAVPQRTPEGFLTAPGVFSADGVDPASRLLADALPAKPGRHVADLGAGWGYLSARLLDSDRIGTLDLVEADHVALDCARANVTDPRARFHWADARTWAADGRLDMVVTNPPFHTGRAADQDLGRGFIAAAARLLAPSGALFMVANRHLAYEAALRAHFGETAEIGGDSRFKVIRAARPSRTAR